MCQNIVYLLPGRRRPIWIGQHPNGDAQGRIPRAWCLRCGREVFAERKDLCDRCERRGGYESVQNLYPGS